jgi:pimeloyl-ACP methyl ester carboxylesterase
MCPGRHGLDMKRVMAVALSASVPVIAAATSAVARLALALTLGGPVLAADLDAVIPSVVISDPAADAAHPPRSAQVLVPSHGFGMNALFYLAGGAGTHPTMVLLHGFPGNEQNLDLAQAVRRAGWNVLTLHYRGSWGSPGVFSLGHVMEDADAAIAFVRRPDIAAKYGIDTQHIVMAGHSMGGFASAAHARTDTALQGVVLIDAWNAGASGEDFSRVTGKARAALAAERFDDLGNSLHGATAASIADDIVAHRKEWNYLPWAASLAHQPLLIIGASRALGDSNRALAEAVTKAGGKVTAETMTTDHSFQDHRIALESAIVNWLQAL